MLSSIGPVLEQHRGRRRYGDVIREMEPRDLQPCRVLDDERPRHFDDLPCQRKAVAGHSLDLAKWPAPTNAGLSGFLTLIKSRDGPDRQGS